jgi:hypothetical protein
MAINCLNVTEIVTNKSNTTVYLVTKNDSVKIFNKFLKKQMDFAQISRNNVTRSLENPSTCDTW